MSKIQLLLKSIKVILPPTIGCILGTTIAYKLEKIELRRYIIRIIGVVLSFFTMISIVWLYYIFKSHKDKIQ